MMAKKQMIKEKKIADVLLSIETTEAQGFLFEGGDDCAMVVYRDEDEEDMDSTIGMQGSVTGEAMEVNEQLEPHRSARPRQLYKEEEFDSEEEEFDDEEMPSEDDANDY
uniref:Uncharacterized protein n=1 Tax=Avena sativa TaxID=4498 RepID=A0ACD5TP51_AVESA